MDVARHGYPVVLTNVAIVALVFLAIAFAALAADRRLPGIQADPKAQEAGLRRGRSPR